jgi:hypothetical protein
MSKAAMLMVGTLIVAAPSLAATSPAARCSGRKLKAVAVAARAYTRCGVDAVAKHGGFVSPACTSAALDPLADRFARSEASGGCATIDDLADVRSMVEFAINGVEAFVDYQAGAELCTSRKLRAIGSKLHAILAAHANAVRSGDAAALARAVARAEARFTDRFAAAEALGPCANAAATATAVEAQLEDPIARLRGKLAPVCGDGVAAGSEACDGADSSCSGRCLADCTCAPIVCGDGVREGSESCDLTDDAACPGRCLADCTCPPIGCGNGVREGTEACDGADDAACPGVCQPNCRCPGICGDGVVNGFEECDGASSTACGTYSCQAPGLLGECQCCSTGYCSGGFPNTCCGANVRCVRNAQSPVGVCTPYTCSQASDCGIGGYNCENGNCCAQPERSCINIGCCAPSMCTFASGVPLCCIPTGNPCTSPHAQGICCSGSCNAGTGVCD